MYVLLTLNDVIKSIMLESPNILISLESELGIMNILCAKKALNIMNARMIASEYTERTDGATCNNGYSFVYKDLAFNAI